MSRWIVRCCHEMKVPFEATFNTEAEARTWYNNISLGHKAELIEEKDEKPNEK
jgi:hypothetical protein